jgi:O-antigen/teichoic acid export membrane protein
VGVVWTLDRRYIRAAPAYGLRAHAANVLGFLGYRLDVFILNAYTSFASVGLYTAAVAVAERLWLPSQAVSTALFPTIAEEKDESVRRAITPLLARNTLWLTAAVAAVVYVFAGPVVSLLYSSKFESSAGPLRTLLPGIVAYSGARVLGNDISARGRPLLNSYIASVSVTLNLVLNLVLIPRHGIVGAAWASTASYSVLFVSTIGLYCRIARVPVRAVIVPMREDATAYVRLARRLLARPAAQDPAGLGLASPLPLPDSESADS